MSNIKKYRPTVVALIALVLGPVGFAHAQVQVTSANPSSAIQGTSSLDVEVSGSGFDSTAQVKFLVTGTIDPGGITIKNVSVRGSKKLVATIDVADSAIVSKFDIEVALSNGRKGKGTTLFAVQAKVNGSDACATASMPAFAYTIRSGKYLTPQIYVADATGACTRLIAGLTDGPAYYPSAQYVSLRLLEPAPDGTVIGRIATQEWGRGVLLFQFSVSATGMQIQNITPIALGHAPATSGTTLSPDGRKLAILDLLSSPAPYTYQLLVADVDACIASPSTCSPAIAYTEPASSDGYGLFAPRWGSDGRSYLEKRSGKLINPSLVRVASQPPYSTSLEYLVNPSGPRLALFDVQSAAGGDVIVFGETTANDPYCYKVKTAAAASCNASSCAVSLSSATVSYWTTVESVEPVLSLITPAVGRRDCAAGSAVVRVEASGGATSTTQPLISRGEWPSAAQ